MSKAPQDPRIETQREGACLVVRFEDCTSLNEYTADRIGALLGSIPLERPDQPVTLDLANVEYITSTVLGHLLVLHKRLKAAGGRLSIRNGRPAVGEILRVTQLDHLLEVQ